MAADTASRKRTFAQVVFGLLSGLPWWIIIVALVGIVVAFSVLTDVRYLDAIYFLFDLPWDRELLAEIPEGNLTVDFLLLLLSSQL